MTKEQKDELLEAAESLIDQANTILLMIDAGFIAGLMDTKVLDKPKHDGNVVSLFGD